MLITKLNAKQGLLAAEPGRALRSPFHAHITPLSQHTCSYGCWWADESPQHTWALRLLYFGQISNRANWCSIGCDLTIKTQINHEAVSAKSGIWPVGAIRIAFVSQISDNFCVHFGAIEKTCGVEVDAVGPDQTLLKTF